MSYEIRPMVLEDLDAVYAIETAAHIAPWSKKIIRDCIVVGYTGFVLVRRKKVRGFTISRIKSGVCHLLNLCIDPKSQKKGFGKALLRQLLTHISTHCIKITLEVRPSNQIAIDLYRKHQFTQTEFKEKYYTDPDGSHEDGLVFSKYLFNHS